MVVLSDASPAISNMHGAPAGRECSREGVSYRGGGVPTVVVMIAKAR